MRIRRRSRGRCSRTSRRAALPSASSRARRVPSSASSTPASARRPETSPRRPGDVGWKLSALVRARRRSRGDPRAERNRQIVALGEMGIGNTTSGQRSLRRAPTCGCRTPCAGAARVSTTTASPGRSRSCSARSSRTPRSRSARSTCSLRSAAAKSRSWSASRSVQRQVASSSSSTASSRRPQRSSRLALRLRLADAFVRGASVPGARPPSCSRRARSRAAARPRPSAR